MLTLLTFKQAFFFGFYLFMHFFIISKNLLASRFSGIALWPFIVVKRKSLLHDTTFINHERIHLRQQAEMLVIPFYIWYLAEFLIQWLRCRNSFLAYRKISFEREAYSAEKDPEYLDKRRFWAFCRFL